MSAHASRLLSLVLPLYNEQAGLVHFHQILCQNLRSIDGYDFEIIYCNDGSNDGSLQVLQSLAKEDKRIRLISLTRNFGKEIATTAGMQLAGGAAIITLDTDGQHPLELLPEFVRRWEAGSKVVIGLRTENRKAGLSKRLGSRLFYAVFNKTTHLGLVSGATDYRLVDQVVQADFNRLTEHNRITRGLIDWLGYERSYINFAAKARLHGDAGYSFAKLSKLAVDSVISLSSSPLYVTAYIGVIVLPLASLLGLSMLINTLFGDPLDWHASGGAYVSVLILFLIGILLMSQGVIGLYLSHIHSETQNRPLYIIDQAQSERL